MGTERVSKVLRRRFGNCRFRFGASHGELGFNANKAQQLVLLKCNHRGGCGETVFRDAYTKVDLALRCH
jgi:hypothetical protein